MDDAVMNHGSGVWKIISLVLGVAVAAMVILFGVSDRWAIVQSEAAKGVALHDQLIQMDSRITAAQQIEKLDIRVSELERASKTMEAFIARIDERTVHILSTMKEVSNAISKKQGGQDERSH